jgi:hypothetical protein
MGFGIKGKVTLTELKLIQGINDNNPLLSLDKQYNIIENQLEQFTLEREKKNIIITNINNGTEL